MRIVHRISQNIDSAMQGELQCLGLHVNTGLTTFEVDEDHPSWKEIKSWIATRDALDVVRTEFSKPELMQAKILRMAPSWHYGYPEPSDDMRFLQETYVESSVCKKCGSGKIQQHPFHLKNEPKWGNRHILQLNWVFDEFFVKPETWRLCFCPFGVGCREVLHVRTGKPLETIVQLCIDETAKVKLLLDDDAKSAQCNLCGVVKYVPLVRGAFPGLQYELGCPIVKTKEVFGSGASSWRAVLVSSELFRTFVRAEIKGVRFIPTSVP